MTMKHMNTTQTSSKVKIMLEFPLLSTTLYPEEAQDMLKFLTDLCMK